LILIRWNKKRKYYRQAEILPSVIKERSHFGTGYHKNPSPIKLEKTTMRIGRVAGRA